ncbi:MAG TPA: DM13 domain-containing protein [Acidimicrobiales bacterium]|nr:DM13 domain-containing protein [Acidimicrobiales bacterium]
MDNDPRRFGRITRGERAVAGVAALVLLVLVVVEPDIVGAPFENARTVAFTVGGTVVAAVLLALMLRFDVAPVVRIIVLVVPFVAVSWWLLAPFFVDDVVDEEFATSIAAELEGGDGPGTDSTGTTSSTAPAAPDGPTPMQETATEPSGPVLLAAGSFVGLAGHSGTGDAGIFENPDGSLALRFEAFDIENGPDLEVYLVPGADQTSLAAGSVHLGALKGNVGDQTYELPPGTELPPGSYTALVWCEAFAVEFVGATLTIG